LSDNAKTLGIILLASGLILIIQTDSFHELIGNYQKITYSELREFIQGSSVERIRIKRIAEGNEMHNKAYVTMQGGSIKVLELGNVDHFLESIENLQAGKDPSSIIPIEFTYHRDFLKT